MSRPPKGTRQQRLLEEPARRYWRQRRAELRLLAALLLAPSLAVTVISAVVAGCYDTTVKTPPCSANSNQEGCLAPIHDNKRPDGGQ